VRDRCMHILQAPCETTHISSYLAHPPDASLARMIGIPSQMLSAISPSIYKSIVTFLSQTCF